VCPLCIAWLDELMSLVEFYLILNVAVGSANGWFPEGQGNKPWLDRAQSKLCFFFWLVRHHDRNTDSDTVHVHIDPARDFANAQSAWYPTWPSNVEDRAMIVYVPLHYAICCAVSCGLWCGCS
jgi:hypothetical protein